jgi:hypothetical protein
MMQPYTQDLALTCEVLGALEAAAQLMDENNELFKSSEPKGLMSTIMNMSRLGGRMDVLSDTAGTIHLETIRITAATAHEICVELLSALERLQSTNSQPSWTGFLDALRMSANKKRQDIVVAIAELYSFLRGRVNTLARYSSYSRLHFSMISDVSQGCNARNTQIDY